MNIRVLTLIFFSLFLLVSCGGESIKSSEKKDSIEQEVPRPLIVEDEFGGYTEWYPGHQQIKIKGRNDAEGNKMGIWKYYSENGVELSITDYNHGLKNGLIIVKYPNGIIRYQGEYYEDEPVGVWLFYDEEGQLTETKEYSE